MAEYDLFSILRQMASTPESQVPILKKFDNEASLNITGAKEEISQFKRSFLRLRYDDRFSDFPMTKDEPFETGDEAYLFITSTLERFFGSRTMDLRFSGELRATKEAHYLSLSTLYGAYAAIHLLGDYQK